MNTPNPEIQIPAVGRRRGRYSAEFKSQVIAARAVEFAILTATQPNEVRGATWDEIDTDGGLWVIPGSRMKGGVTHHVPLSMAAQALLGQIPTR